MEPRLAYALSDHPPTVHHTGNVSSVSVPQPWAAPLQWLSGLKGMNGD